MDPMPQQSQQVPPQEPVSATSKSGLNPWILLSFVLLLAIVGAGAYLLGKNQFQSSKVVSMSPTAFPTQGSQATMTPQVTPAPSVAQTGTVSGKLCYPASGIPKGSIVAKSLTTGQLVTQEYPGSQNGGGATYTLQLKPDTYHLEYTNEAIAGYYTDYSSCVESPNDAKCSGQQTRPLLPVKVDANMTASNVNLCDFYYNPANPPTF